ncbi:adaptin ear-binding coat-associated protein 1 NECAP-1 [Lepidopterella palustris CBS 459.81]|uniref:Adaptin ear-binding coat-associated protein 1 NECAP-1 n=1 Tax=Lepidopterella palustris CBS 459.81 TaxID=1314670 RepID=A0A8E2JH54_9PEZI|nr:adaptin ear-binding coat-associated protein 1 NECAP-1 [Lepidopterella palustris CBS 459.81]
MNTDPTTGQPIPPDAIQRILFIAPKVHVYNIPPLTSTKGYTAATWTANNNRLQIFTARLRILETAIPLPSSALHPAEKVSTTLLLEDPATGALFAAAPYTAPAAVEQALDSSRFFAVRVVGEGGRKATLGIGFEERSDAFDFSIALQDARRVLGMEHSSSGSAPGRKSGAGAQDKKEGGAEEKRDFSLKEGEMITVNIGGRGRRGKISEDTRAEGREGREGREEEALFSIKPPPGSGMPFLPPPPSAREVKEERRRSRQNFADMQPSDLGFDDGEFGEFQ